MISPTNYETDSDVGSRESQEKSRLESFGQKSEEIIGKDIFVQTMTGPKASWALTKGAKILV